MDAPTPPRPITEPNLVAFDANPAAWKALFDELTLLTVKLEYLRLLLKLGVRRF